MSSCSTHCARSFRSSSSLSGICQRAARSGKAERGAALRAGGARRLQSRGVRLHSPRRWPSPAPPCPRPARHCPLCPTRTQCPSLSGPSCRPAETSPAAKGRRPRTTSPAPAALLVAGNTPHAALACSVPLLCPSNQQRSCASSHLLAQSKLPIALSSADLANGATAVVEDGSRAVHNQVQSSNVNTWTARARAFASAEGGVAEWRRERKRRE